MVGVYKRVLIGIFFSVIALPSQAKLQAKIASYPIASTILTKFSVAFGDRSKRSVAPLVVESVGVKSMDQFCSVSQNSPDVMVTHKRLNAVDLSSCSNNGVIDFLELKLGHGAIVVLASPDLKLSNISAQEIYQAITKLLFKQGRVISNGVHTWSQVANQGYDLPNVPIKVYIPGPNADLRDVFQDRILVNGCQSDPEIVKLKSDVPKLYGDLCLGVRSDQAIQNMESFQKQSHLEILNILSSQKGVVILASPDILQEAGIDKYVVAVDGHKPTYASIRDDSYPLSSPIFLYVKMSSLKSVESLRKFLLYIYSGQNRDVHTSESAGFMSLTDQERHDQFTLVQSGYPNFRLDKADVVDRALSSLKNFNINLPESPAEPDMPQVFSDTPLDKKMTASQNSAQDFTSKPSNISSSIDDQLHTSGASQSTSRSDYGLNDSEQENDDTDLEDEAFTAQAIDEQDYLPDQITDASESTQPSWKSVFN